MPYSAAAAVGRGRCAVRGVKGEALGGFGDRAHELLETGRLGNEQERAYPSCSPAFVSAADISGIRCLYPYPYGVLHNGTLWSSVGRGPPRLGRALYISLGLGSGTAILELDKRGGTA
jgi:hypothetical protein